MTSPYCPALNAALLERASSRGLEVRPSATYACTNGPRFESPAEIRDLAGRGADVVGMTGCRKSRWPGSWGSISQGSRCR